VTQTTETTQITQRIPQKVLTSSRKVVAWKALIWGISVGFNGGGGGAVGDNPQQIILVLVAGPQHISTSHCNMTRLFH